MPFYRPPLSEIATGIFNDAVGRLRLKAAVLRRTLIGVLCRAFAGAVHGLYGYLSHLARQMFVHLCDNDYLDLHGAERGVGRKGANTAEGYAVALGKDGQTLKTGTKAVYGSDRSRIYIVQEDADFEGGSAKVHFKAAAAGEQGNLPAGANLYLVSPQSGIQSTLTIGRDGINGGVDAESPDSYRARILDKIRNPPHGGNENDYKQWAKEIPSVERAWCIPLYAGLGTVGVMVARGAEADDPRLDPVIIEMLNAHIQKVRPVTAEVILLTPILHPVDFLARISPNTQAVRDAITAELRDFLIRDGAPDSYLRYSRISEAVSTALGEHHHELVAPGMDIFINKTELPVMGKVLFEDFAGKRSW